MNIVKRRARSGDREDGRDCKRRATSICSARVYSCRLLTSLSFSEITYRYLNTLSLILIHIALIQTILCRVPTIYFVAKSNKTDLIKFNVYISYLIKNIPQFRTSLTHLKGSHFAMKNLTDLYQFVPRRVINS